MENNTIFNKDIATTGHYLYTSKDKLSCVLSSNRINEEIQKIINIKGKTFFDAGCGDGSTSLFLYKMGAKLISGIDPAAKAVKVANTSCAPYINDNDNAGFKVGDISSYVSKHQYDILLFSGSLHHMENPEKAIYNSQNFSKNVLIIEPNGHNPILKFLEKFSKYHIEHNERSFSFATIQKWLNKAGFTIVRHSYINLVPMFCPDWMAKLCKLVEPFIERIPIIRNIFCGQLLIYAEQNITK